MEHLVRERLQPLDIPRDRYEKHLRTALAIGTTAYAHMPIGIQVHITIYTTLTTSMDDFDIPLVASEQFVTRFVSGLPQLSPALDALADNLRHMSDYYCPHAASGIITSTLDFINSTMLEREIQAFVVSEDAENYAIYTRFKNGVSQAYGLFMWDKFTFPELSSYFPALP